MTKAIELYGCKGCGSAIVEAAFTLAHIPYTFIDANYDDPSKLQVLKKINPLGQVPALVLPDGMILTESAAIINYLHLQNSSAGLIPQSPDQNIQYGRWISFLIGAIYPTFTYGDFPEKWAGAGSSLKGTTDEWRKSLWLQVEKEVQRESFLSSFSALDLYLSVMIFWRPGRSWFEENCPGIHRIARKVHQMPSLQETFLRNFPKEF